MVNLSSSICSSCDRNSSIVPECEIFVISMTRMLGTKNSIGMNAFYPYTNMKGVFPINLLLVVLYAHNTTGTLNSESSLPTLHVFVSAFSRILLNAYTMPLACGWYGILF